MCETCKVVAMAKTDTLPYDVAEHLRTRADMAAYLEASIEEADGDAAFVAKALGDIARAAVVPEGERVGLAVYSRGE